MVRSGAEYIDGLKDNRLIYLNGERVGDVTTHPAFKGIINTIAGLYDMAADESQNMTYETETGARANKSFIIPRSREDLAERRKAISKWAEATCGFVGRSPDHVACVLSGMAGSPDIFERGGKKYKDNIISFYKFARDRDLFLTYVIIPPQINRSKAAFEQDYLYSQAGVYEENEDGIVIRGSMMLGTSAAVSDYLFVSCLTPLKPGDEKFAISFVVPINASGLKMYARPSYAMNKPSDFDYPLSTRFDESDSMVMFDDVFIPWEHVFIYKDIQLVRAQFHEAPTHVYGNTQAQIRFAVKLKFLLGVARKITKMNGTDTFPQVKEKLGELASLAATVESALLGAEYNCKTTSNGIVYPDRRFLYGVVGMQDKLYPEVVKILREFAAGGVLQLPSTYKEMIHPDTKEDIHRIVRSASNESEKKIQLFKLAWDIIGSEFGGRHQQYELFYNGASFVTKGYSYRDYGYEEPEQLVDRFLDTYTIPDSKM